jgi:polyferredoxin
MRIVTVRRVSQSFFAALFLWFCIASSFGSSWWQLRGWPVNWFLQLDPLVALGTLVTTGTVYAGLAWALVTVVLTILLGRFFCGWVCPWGSLQQLTGYLGRRWKPFTARVLLNQPQRAQVIKYGLLTLLVAAAAGSLVAQVTGGVRALTRAPWGLAALAAAGLLFIAWKLRTAGRDGRTAAVLLTVGVGAALGSLTTIDSLLEGSLQTGLLDPIVFLHRSVNLVLLPLADSTWQRLSTSPRHYAGAWLIGGLFLLLILLNLRTPRFYCRYLCPLGALFGILGRYALWRMGKETDECLRCQLCEANCEGACQPAGKTFTHECVLCMNCRADCAHGLVTYRAGPSAAGEELAPDLSRRQVLSTVAAGVLFVPLARLGGIAGPDWNPGVVRPPGALAEPRFLARCIKCGQCMRVCPTNIIQPAAGEAGLEGLWTPVLNFRIGTSGCQLNCVACNQLCPTAALRPMSLDEKLGRGQFAARGPIRLGTAFVDRGRCLPWSMDRPCIVCQENCPVSPKAIFVREHFSTVRGGAITLRHVSGSRGEWAGGAFQPGELASGDYFLTLLEGSTEERWAIVANGLTTVEVAAPPRSPRWTAGAEAAIQVRLQQPQVDPRRCIGCGVCEHECPVSGLRAIRVSAENESRNRNHSLFL